MKKKTHMKGQRATSVGVEPLGDRILVREIKKANIETKTASGIFLPASTKDDQGSKRGEVVAVGTGRIENGKRIPLSVHVGDTVLYTWGDSLAIDEGEYVFVNEANILAIIKK